VHVARTSGLNEDTSIGARTAAAIQNSHMTNSLNGGSTRDGRLPPSLPTFIARSSAPIMGRQLHIATFASSRSVANLLRSPISECERLQLQTLHRASASAKVKFQGIAGIHHITSKDCKGSICEVGFDRRAPILEVSVYRSRVETKVFRNRAFVVPRTFSLLKLESERNRAVIRWASSVYSVTRRRIDSGGGIGGCAVNSE
jgi:hypothetical protein